MILRLLLEQCHLGADVDLEIEGRRHVIHSISCPRQGWDEKFKGLAETGNDLLFDRRIANQSSWDKDEWQW